VPHVSKMRKEGAVATFLGQEWIRLSNIVRYTLVLDDDRSNKDWRKHVKKTFTDLVSLIEPLDEPVFMLATFYRPRPKNHYTSKGELSAEGLRMPKPTTRPDTFKMARSIEDALTGLAYRDDSMICDHVIRKRWCERGGDEGVHLVIWPDSQCPVEVLIHDA